MTDTASGPTPLDLDEQITRIRRAQAESDKFVDEQRKLRAEEAKFRFEQDKFRFEQDKLRAEALKLERDRALAPWQIVVGGAAAGAALFGAGAAFIKLIGA